MILCNEANFIKIISLWRLSNNLISWSSKKYRCASMYPYTSEVSIFWGRGRSWVFQSLKCRGCMVLRPFQVEKLPYTRVNEVNKGVWQFETANGCNIMLPRVWGVEKIKISLSRGKIETSDVYGILRSTINLRTSPPPNSHTQMLDCTQACMH